MAHTEPNRDAKTMDSQPQGSLLGSEPVFPNLSSPLKVAVSCHETVLASNMTVSQSTACHHDTAGCGPKFTSERVTSPSEHAVVGPAAQGAQQVPEEADPMTLEELASEKITCGESKKGMTYAQAFEDAQWTEFILNRFETSDKPEHMMFVQYVRLKLQNAPVKTKGYNQTEKMKETKGGPPVPPEVWEEVMPTDGSDPADLMNLSFVQEEMQDLRQSNQHLSNRMGQVEMMMQEMLEHMRKMSSLNWPDGSAPAALASLLFDPPEPQIIGKAQCFALFLPFRASASSFF